MPKKEEEPKGAPLWMCTFSDMMSLLLCFFVLLFALSTIEKKKLIQASGSLRKAFGGLPAPYVVENIPDKRTKPELSRPAQPERRTSYAKDELRREEELKIKALNLQHVVRVTGTEQGITFRLNGDALFERGESRLTVEGADDAILALNFIAGELIRFPSNPVKIEGHTDNTFRPSDPDFNWELGADRAHNVMRFLVSRGSVAGRVAEDRFTYESYAQFKPLPDVDPDTAIGRAQNRRVDIVLLQSDRGDGTFFADPNVKNPRTPLANQARGTEADAPL